jgi:hypothetical protein
MDEKQLRKYAGLNESEEALSEAVDVNGMFSDMKEIAEEFKADRTRVRALLRHIAKGDAKNAKITEDFLTDFLGVIFADQERGKRDDLK